MAEEPRKPVGVIVVDFNVPFGRLTLLILKCSIAAIPAIVLFWLLWREVGDLTGGTSTEHVAPATPPAPVASAVPPVATSSTRANDLEPDLGVMTRQIRIDSKRNFTFRACARLTNGAFSAACTKQAGDCIRAVPNAAVTESETQALLGCLETVGQ